MCGHEYYIPLYLQVRGPGTWAKGCGPDLVPGIDRSQQGKTRIICRNWKKSTLVYSLSYFLVCDVYQLWETLYEPSTLYKLGTLFVLTWTSQLSLDCLGFFLPLKTSLFLLGFLFYITSSIYQAVNVSSDIYTASLQHPAPLVFLTLLICEQNGKGGGVRT